jgi:hypothetical protein
MPATHDDLDIGFFFNWDHIAWSLDNGGIGGVAFGTAISRCAITGGTGHAKNNNVNRKIGQRYATSCPSLKS